MEQTKKTKVTTLDELYGIKESDGDSIINAPLDDVVEFAGNPYRVRNDEEMERLVGSIKQIGVQTPCAARKRDDGKYELLSGHRRKLASKLAGLNTLPLVVLDVDDDTAVIHVVDGNLQRETILPSEKAKAYKMKLEAIKRVGGRPKNNSSQIGTSFKADAKIAEEAGESRNQIARYIRLNELIPELLEMVDIGQLGFTSAVEISFLSPQEQGDLLEVVKSEDRIPNLSQAQRLKQLSGNLDLNKIFEIMQQGNEKQKGHIKLKCESIKGYFPNNYSPQQMEKKIVELLVEWQEKRADAN